MKRQSVRQHLEKKFSQQQLTDSQLEQLMAMQEQAPEQKNRQQVRRFIVAAMVACVLFLASVYPYVTFNDKSRLLENIASEVALNHFKLKPLEVRSATVDGLEHYFTELDFVPARSAVFDANNNKRLLGGRYCSIRGVTAAQLRYQADGGEFVTLYEAVDNGKQFSAVPDTDQGESPAVIYARGFKVRVWRERGLIFASVNE